MSDVMRRFAAAAVLGALVLAATALPGCSNKGCTCPDEAEDIYPARTSPENVIEKLRLAYTGGDLEAYLDCLAEEFVFVLNHDDPWPELPETWDKAEEDSIHRHMFEAVERITLTFTLLSAQYHASSAAPSDPTSGTWEYTEGTDLRVTVPGDLVLAANTDQLFMFAVDEGRVGAGGETLWAIIEWHDLVSERKPPREDASWTCIKALYR